MKRSSLFFLSFLIFSSLFFLRTDPAFGQDSVTVKEKNMTGMSIGVGIPSGINLFVHQQLVSWMYAEAGVGFVLIANTYNAGLRFKIGGDSSNQIIGFRYTIADSYWGSYSVVSACWGHFSLKPSESPFFFGIGVTLPITKGLKFTILPFAEIGLRLFSF